MAFMFVKYYLNYLIHKSRARNFTVRKLELNTIHNNAHSNESLFKYDIIILWGEGVSECMLILLI